MTKRFVYILAVFVLLSSTSGQQLASEAQTPADSKTQQELNKAEQELNKKAESLLTEVTQHARELRNKDNQVLVRIAVADLLWKTHEATARVLFKEAFDTLRQPLTSADESQSEENESDGSVSQLRERLLQSLSRHDPMMARDLLRKDRPAVSSDATKPNPAPADDRSSDTRLELSFAIEMVNQNPKDAVRIAREALSEGYPYELISLLPKLAEKEPRLAQELALEIINKLRKEDLSTNYQALSMATSLAREAISSVPAGQGEEQTEKRTPFLDPQTSREFIQFLTEAALKKTAGQPGGPLLMSLQSLMEDLEQFAPAQAALLKERYSEMEKASNAGEDPYSRFQQLAETNDTKAMLEYAETAPREVRDSLYSQAASMAWQQGDKTKANEIINNKISNPLERSRLSISFQDRTITDLIEKEDFPQARLLIAQIRSGEHRVQQLIELAAALTEKGSKQTALEVLQEAQGLMGSKARSGHELEAQLRIAGALSQFDADRSFAMIGSAIDQINELIAASALIANFGSSGAMISSGAMMKDDEFVVDSSFTIPFGFSSLSSSDIRTLAQVDFNRTREMFDKFQRPEIRIAAYLLMSGSILEPPPTPDDCTCLERLKKLKSKTSNNAAP